MKIRNLLLVSALCCAGIVNAGTTNADLILRNGRIQTPDGWKMSMAVRDGIIVAVGSDAEVDKFKGRETNLIDLKGSTVLPGLHDMHVHPLLAGSKQFACDFKSSADLTTILATVKTCVATKRPGEWIMGGSWLAANFKPGEQTKEILDKIAPDNPVVLADAAYHSLWVNSAALKGAGISRSTPDPKGGVIERDKSGEPTGLLRERAYEPILAAMPPASLADRRAALTLATNQMLSFGITSFMVASVREPDMLPLSQLSAEGVIPQRARGCIVWQETPAANNLAGERLIAERNFYATPRFKPNCVKIFLDGIPTEGHTAAMIEPYEAHSGETATTGMLMIAPDRLKAVVQRFDREGLHLKFHAAGDGAVRAALDAITSARKANGLAGPIHTIGHSTLVERSDMARARDQNIAWEFSPYLWFPTPMVTVDIMAAVGPKRMENWMPIRDALASGALVAAGSDWPIVPTVNPWLAIETMVTRELPGGSKATVGESQRISLEQALTVMTANGAQLMGQADQVGRLSPGMQADFVITTADPFAVPVRDINKIRAKMTFINGKKVFDIASPPRLTAR